MPTVVVGAVGDDHGHAVGVVVGPYEVVGRGLRGRIGRVRVVSGSLGEELLAVGRMMFSARGRGREGRLDALGPCHLQSPVHLVGGDVVEQLACPITVPVLPRSFEQRERAQDVRTRESERIPDRAVDTSRAKIASTGLRKVRAILSASSVEGTNFPVSTAFTVWRLTPTASASCCWVMRTSARSTRILFFIGMPI